MRCDLRRVAGIACALASVVAAAAQEASSPSGSVAQRLEQYQPGRSAVPPPSRAALWSGADDFRRDAAVWIAAGDSLDAPRRRLAVATYVLDMLKDVDEALLWQDTQAAATLVEWGCARLRESPPIAAESAWHIVALALLERSSTVTVLEGHLAHAEERFPQEDRWPLVRALVDEWRSQDRRRDDGTLAVPDGLAARAVRHFEQAASRTSVRQEALLRWGAYESDLGRHDAALARFDQIGEPTDPFLRYWLGVIKGRVLRRAKRPDDAIAAYRTAVAELPTAQSGAFGLAAALVSAGRTAEGAAAVSRAIGAGADSPVPDPWLIYRSPDVRFWPAALDDLREAVTR